MPPELNLPALEWQAVLNLMAVTFIQWLKTNDRPIFAWINQNTPWITRFVAAVIATATASGIHMQFIHTGDSYGLSLTGITFVAVAHFVKDILQNYYGVKIGYRLLKPDQYAPAKPHPLDLGGNSSPAIAAKGRQA